MRDIEFRAWHKNNKSMCYNVTTDLLNRDWLEFMQYTGLKDANSKEIYEGDIIGLSNGTAYKYEVVFSFGCFMARDKDGYCRNLYEIIEPIVIGNIYENFESLESGKNE